MLEHISQVNYFTNFFPECSFILLAQSITQSEHLPTTGEFDGMQVKIAATIQFM